MKLFILMMLIATSLLGSSFVEEEEERWRQEDLGTMNDLLMLKNVELMEIENYHYVHCSEPKKEAFCDRFVRNKHQKNDDLVFIKKLINRMQDGELITFEIIHLKTRNKESLRLIESLKKNGKWEMYKEEFENTEEVIKMKSSNNDTLGAIGTIIDLDLPRTETVSVSWYRDNYIIFILLILLFTFLISPFISRRIRKK